MTTWIAGGVAALAIAAAGLQTVRLASEKTDFAEARATWADTRAEAERMRAKAESVQRDEETRRQQEKDNAILEAKSKLAVMAADLVRADRAAASLRDAARAAAKRASEARGSAGTGTGGTPTTDAAGVLADVLASIDERAGILAKIAGERGIAGATCERSYDSLTPK
ncbi:MAG: DUF2514 family protein [Polaromonas sp.]|uniref:DUF2514 family protein n=1 Tax=Polaromonas sp. TaxID=1869339 RepID=UPI0027254CDF|nr:DUF2514 family protein [Polaromonas sp.]MDO9114511.1 DUF2514 family protein [Polaromonas sp.]